MTETSSKAMALEFEELKRWVLAFRDERDWKQFHDPKNLAEAIAIEAAELLEIFLWADSQNSVGIARDKQARIKGEAADIFIFLLYLCEEAGVDLPIAVRQKLLENEMKYPVDKARGRSEKYKEL